MQMEAMMKDICEGRRTKNDVVYESIGMYREVFMKANREVNVLVEVGLVRPKLTSGMSAIPAECLMRYRQNVNNLFNT
jgi:hypothetical protein